MPEHAATPDFLVVTDRQVLWLVDALSPNSVGMIDWGYVVLSAAVEPIVDVRMDADRSPAFPVLELGTSRARGTLRLEFPGDRATLLDDVAKLLRGFLPLSDSRSLRRFYRRTLVEAVAQRAVWPATLLGEPLPEDVIRLIKAARQVLCPGESALAAAVAPSPAGRRVARLVATDRHLLALERGRDPALRKDNRLADLTVVTRRWSLVGCAFEVRSGLKGDTPVAGVRFDYPQSPEFRAIFQSVRQLRSEPEVERAVTTDQPEAAGAR